VRRYVDLLAVCAVQAACALLLLQDSASAAELVVPALLFVIVCPGYALLEATLPLLSDVPVRVLVAVAMGMSAAVVAGLVLDATPWGLDRESWVAALALLVALAALVAAVRRWFVEAAPQPRTRLGRPTLLVAAFTIGGLVLTIEAVVVARIPLPAHHTVGYTMLSASPPSRKGSLTIEVQSGELSRSSYRLVARRGGRTLAEWRGIRLDPGDRWRATVRLDALGRDRTSRQRTVRDPLSFVLFRTDRSAAPYREIRVRPEMT